MSGYRRRGRRTSTAVGLALAASVLAGCGGDDGGTPTLNWYINPDSGGQATIAAACTEASGGRYRLSTSLLPREAAGQREQLVRRLAANDDSIDIMSIDPPFLAEFAEAGFISPLPEETAEVVTEDVVQPAIDHATWRDELVAAPFWANTQLLWYRKSVAEAAGLDMTQPVTWQQLIDAASSQRKLLGVQGTRGESLTVWLNALIESAGGSIIAENSEDPEEIQFGLREEPAVAAAEVMRAVPDAGVGGPALSTANEDANATGFEGPDAGFMVNWPFVWSRALSAVESGTMDPSVPDDYGWTIYPQVVEGQDSAPPLGGIVLGVGAFSQHQDLAFEALECITSEDNQAAYMISDGNPAAKAGVYDRAEVLESFPMAPVIRQSLEQAAPRPQTPYYNEVSGGVQRVYHPPSSVTPGETGEQAAELIESVLGKEQLL